jgi:hypothetical protein
MWLDFHIPKEKEDEAAFIRSVIDEILKTPCNALTFSKHLKSKGVEVKTIWPHDGRMVPLGFLFSVGNLFCTGAIIGVDYTWDGLITKGLEFNHVKDCMELRKIAPPYDVARD